MNRGFKIYYKEGYNASKEALKKKGNLCRYYLYVLVNLLSCLMIFIKPVVDMAGIRLLKMIRSDKDIAVSKSISGSDNSKSYWTCLLAYLIKGLMILAIILAIGLLGLALAGFGYAIYSASAFSKELYNLPIIFMVPAIAILVIFLLALPMLTAPISYIVDTNPNMGASKVLFCSIDALKKDGKRTLLISYLLEVLIKILFLVIPIGLLAYLNSNLLSEPAEVVGLMIGITILVIIAEIIVYILFVTKFVLALKLSRVLLYEDLVLDNFNGTKRLTGIEFKEEKPEYKSKLERLFDNTEGSSKDFNILNELREINSTRVLEDNTIPELSEEERLVINAIPESDLSDMQKEREELEIQIEEASVIEAKEISQEEIEEIVEPVAEEIIEEQQEEIEAEAEEPIAQDELMDDAYEASKEDEIIIEEIEAKAVLESVNPVDEAIENELTEDVEEIIEERQELTEEELELLNAIPSTEYDDDMKELMDELRAFEEKHQDLDDDEIKALDSEELFNSENDIQEDNEFNPESITEEEIEEMINEVGDDLFVDTQESELSADELDILNSIPDAVEEIVYVDEEGNPIEIDDNSIIEDEEIMYVDEEGNPVDVDMSQIEESPVVDEFESFINSLETQDITEEVEEKPKRGRRKKTKEGE